MNKKLINKGKAKRITFLIVCIMLLIVLFASAGLCSITLDLYVQGISIGTFMLVSLLIMIIILDFTILNVLDDIRIILKENRKETGGLENENE
jgi:uncharacterized membrane protein YhaH (DUF805 family)